MPQPKTNNLAFVASRCCLRSIHCCYPLWYKIWKKNAGMSWSVRLALYRKAAVYLPRDLNEKMNIYLPERNLKPFWLQTAVAEN